MRRAGNRGTSAPIDARRCGVIGDVHTERVRLQGVLTHLRALGLEHIVCTGDVPDGPHGAREVDACCALLGAAGVYTISGNHDRWLQDSEMRDLPGATDRHELTQATLDFLAALPVTLSLRTPSGSLLVCHGMGEDDMAGLQSFDRGLALESNEALQELLRQRRYRYVVAGHTHRPMVRAIEGITFINAGTLLGGQSPCCAVADFERKQLQLYDVAEDGSVTPGATFEL